MDIHPPVTRVVAFATHRALPDLTSDDRLAVPELRALGVEVAAVCWDDAAADWSQYDAVIIRSVWDYHLRLSEFIGWLNDLRAQRVTVLNTPDVLEWNSNKRYLLDLQRREVPIVPTFYVTRDRAASLEWILETNRWNKAVVKPAVSASSHNTWITDASNAARDQAKFGEMLLWSEVLVQPLMNEVVRDGEYSLVFFNRHFSHAARKRPRRGEFRTQPEFGGSVEAVSADPRWVHQARAVLDLIPRPLLYARVDGVVRDGQFVLMELELIEPDLGLSLAPAAPRAFALAIQSALSATLADARPAHALLPSEA